MEILIRSEFDRFSWGEMLREQWDYNVGTNICFIVIVGWIVIFRVFAFVLLKNNVKKFN